MSTVTLAETNGKMTQQSTAWLRSTVKAFFSSFNWEDHSPEVQELQQTAVLGSAGSLSLTLTVSQFFQAIPWDGVAIAAPATVELESSLDTSASTAFTLDDFSSLF